MTTTRGTKFPPPPRRTTGGRPQYPYGGKVYVLANAASFSASILFCAYFRKSGAGLIAGTPTGGYSKVTGGARIPVRYRLARLFPMKVPHILSNPLEEEGYRYIDPDIPIQNDFHSWVRGEDSSLTQLLEMIEKGNILLPARF